KEHTWVSALNCAASSTPTCCSTSRWFPKRNTTTTFNRCATPAAKASSMTPSTATPPRCGMISRTRTRRVDHGGQGRYFTRRDPWPTRRAPDHRTHDRQMDHVHRPQSDRVHVPDHHIPVLHARGPHGPGHPCGTIRTGRADRQERRAVQPAVHDAWHDHAAAVRDAPVC